MRDGEGGVERPDVTDAPVKGRINLRLYVASPPPGVVHAVIDRSGVPLDPQMSTGDALGYVYDLDLVREATGWRYGGDCVWRDLEGRDFLIVAAGTEAGQIGATSGERARVTLPVLTESMIGVARTDTLHIEAAYVGRGPGGGPPRGDVDARWRSDDAGWMTLQLRQAHAVLDALSAHYEPGLPIAAMTIFGWKGMKYQVVVLLNTQADVAYVRNSTVPDSMRAFVLEGLEARNMGERSEMTVEILLLALDDKPSTYGDYFRGLILPKQIG